MDKPSERLARIEMKLSEIHEDLRGLSTHEIRIDRLEIDYKRAGRFAWLIFSGMTGLILDFAWRRLSGGH